MIFEVHGPTAAYYDVVSLDGKHAFRVTGLYGVGPKGGA